jgi:hypothetical protein
LTKVVYRFYIQKIQPFRCLYFPLCFGGTKVARLIIVDAEQSGYNIWVWFCILLWSVWIERIWPRCINQCDCDCNAWVNTGDLHLNLEYYCDEGL